MAVTITRTAWTDDDGSGTTGTVINNAVKTGDPFPPASAGAPWAGASKTPQAGVTP